MIIIKIRVIIIIQLHHVNSFWARGASQSVGNRDKQGEFGGIPAAPPCIFPNFPQGFSAGLQTDSAARRFAVGGTQPGPG
jgi:hypothetical protein